MPAIYRARNFTGAAQVQQGHCDVGFQFPTNRFTTSTNKKGINLKKYTCIIFSLLSQTPLILNNYSG